MHLWARSHNQLGILAPSLYDQHLMRQGQQVETLARKMIKNILLPRYSSAQLLWQSTYDDGQFEIRADALILDQVANFYDLYEIKSSTSINTTHEFDLTFQVLLLESLLKLRHVYILHLDRTYQLGQDLDLEELFIIEEVSNKVEKRREDVAKKRQEAWTVTQMDAPQSSFACTKPKSCPCSSLCHPVLPERPIYNIPYIGKKAVQLREMGITAIEDIPASFDLNPKQRKHISAVKSNQPIIDAQEIRQSLGSLQYPLYFLDYETFNPAIPLFPKYHPFEHIIFQYSLFVINEPEADPQHYDCLLTGASDPAPKLVTDLLSHLGPRGSVVVWNQSFEANCNKSLAEHCPDYADQLLGINDRLYDLMLVFKDGHFVHPDFHGSASLKAVLPVLCPDLRYEELTISNGEEAMLTWYRIQMGEFLPEERAGIEADMKAYCRLDTFGMIGIWKKLRE